MTEARYEINLRANSPVRGMQLGVTLMDSGGNRSGGREIRLTIEGNGTFEETNLLRETSQTTGADGETMISWWDASPTEGGGRTASVIASCEVPGGQLQMRHLKTFYARVA